MVCVKGGRYIVIPYYKVLLKPSFSILLTIRFFSIGKIPYYKVLLKPYIASFMGNPPI